MFLKARPLEIEALKPIVILNRDDADELDVRPLDRVELVVNNKKVTAIVNVAEVFILKGEIGLSESVHEDLRVRMGEKVKVRPAEPPESIIFIKNKLSGNVLKSKEIEDIVADVAGQKLSDIEVTAFVTGLYMHGMAMNEIAALSHAMAEAGKSLRFKTKEIFDKHSIGGIPGDKTSLLLVPVIAAAGLTIPKTSSRAITAPAGTADRMECLCPVDLTLEEIKGVVNKTNGCLVWGGAVELAPADDMFIQVEYPLSIDPLLLPSVMSKKKAVNVKYLVIDIPTGRGVKVKTTQEAEDLANKFIDLGKKLKIKVDCVSTFADQPIGYGVGPALEAREALSTIEDGKGPKDLIDKVTCLSSVLFDFKKINNPKDKISHILKSGKADKKLREIIAAQGGDPKIKPEDIPVGKKSIKVKSNKSGRVLWINNHFITRMARVAGAPKNKGAGILLHKKLADKVKRGDILFEIYAESGYKLKKALDIFEKKNVVGVGKKYSIVLAEIPEEEKRKKYFILER
ncbi:MAG: AMP phosphorylase [Candidatus Aenigmatarchaeota archaeon]|nr:MAG: AMP phosphorylase [Candidatus Aenigmarchaeota archaeon]